MDDDFQEKVRRLREIWEKQDHDEKVKQEDGTPTADELLQQFVLDVRSREQDDEEDPFDDSWYAGAD